MYLTHIVCNKNVVKRIEFLAMSDLWRYSQRVLRTNSLERGTPCQKR